MHLHICAQRPNYALFAISTAFPRLLRGPASWTIVIALTTSFWQIVQNIVPIVSNHSERSATDHVLVMLLPFRMTLKALRTRPQCRTAMAIALNYEATLRTWISKDAILCRIRRRIQRRSPLHDSCSRLFRLFYPLQITPTLRAFKNYP